MPSVSPSSPDSARTRVALVSLAVFALAFGLRLVGIGWGLPIAGVRNDSLHPDEPINLLYATRAIEPARLSFTPDFYNYGTLYLTATRISSDVATTYIGKESLRAPLLGPRLLNVFLGSLTAALVAAFFARRGRMWAAWSAGLAVAFAAGLVVHARFATVDVMATAFLTFGLLVAAGVPDSPRPSRALLGAAALVGMATACKYNMALGLFGVFVAASALPRERRVIAVGASVLVFLAVFIVGVPGVILQPQSFKRDVMYELAHTAAGHGLVFSATPSGFLYHLGNLALATGILATLLGVVGLAGEAYRRQRWAFVVLAFVVPYYLLIGRAEVKFLRYVLPLVPPLAMGFGALVARIADDPEPKRRLLAGATAILALGGVDRGGLSGSLPLSLEMAGTDPRDAAGASLRRVAGTGSVGIARDPWFWTPTLYPDVAAPRSKGPPFILGTLLRASDPRVLRYLPPDPRERQDFDVRLFDLQPDYVTLTTLEIAAAERFLKAGDLPPEETALRERYRAFTARLNAEYKIDRTYGIGRPPVVEDLEYVRPTVYVFKRR